MSPQARGGRGAAPGGPTKAVAGRRAGTCSDGLRAHKGRAHLEGVRVECRVQRAAALAPAGTSSHRCWARGRASKHGLLCGTRPLSRGWHALTQRPNCSGTDTASRKQLPAPNCPACLSCSVKARKRDSGSSQRSSCHVTSCRRRGTGRRARSCRLLNRAGWPASPAQRRPGSGQPHKLWQGIAAPTCSQQASAGLVWCPRGSRRASSSPAPRLPRPFPTCSVRNSARPSSGCSRRSLMSSE